ncbi:MAG: hypothetical protein JWQ26_3369, partial [Modestobacter sp.]|nr:hypothetical protein [Modestobacter sp.]
MPRRSATDDPLHEQYLLGRDPRHRPVVLEVASQRPHEPRTGMPPGLRTAAGTCLAVLTLLFGTLASAWAGWQVAESDGRTQVAAGPPNVPQGPAVELPPGEAPATEAPATEV